MNMSEEYWALDKFRTEAPGPYTPTRSEMVHIIVALYEAEANAKREGRTSTAKSYADLRDKLDATIENDLIEKLWREAM